MREREWPLAFTFLIIVLVLVSLLLRVVFVLILGRVILPTALLLLAAAAVGPRSVDGRLICTIVLILIGRRVVGLVRVPRVVGVFRVVCA